MRRLLPLLAVLSLLVASSSLSWPALAWRERQRSVSMSLEPVPNRIPPCPRLEAQSRGSRLIQIPRS